MAGMFTTSQCQKPEPVGASGSKQVTAKLLVPAGASTTEDGAICYRRRNQSRNRLDKMKSFGTVAVLETVADEGERHVPLLP
jgi:hypothetical protein